MKKLALALCVTGAAFAFSACDSTGSGNVETAVPYSTERTASHSNAAPVQQVQTERVFRTTQTK